MFRYLPKIPKMNIIVLLVWFAVFFLLFWLFRKGNGIFKHGKTIYRPDFSALFGVFNFGTWRREVLRECVEHLWKPQGKPCDLGQIYYFCALQWAYLNMPCLWPNRKNSIKYFLSSLHIKPYYLWKFVSLHEQSLSKDSSQGILIHFCTMLKILK